MDIILWPYRLPGQTATADSANSETAVTRVRKFVKKYPRAPGTGFMIDNPQDYYCDWDKTGVPV